ncbi:hypothetical protein AV530_000069 [Patagioenas fasciata monilis]|uniref:Uncharacterized protein n=1 Tax=Patagioenas fasciata monilis TaxID=372326 RepID=A0A1V4JZX0_PATFA|nr:hypothetical protein AV530_000069 [Patagioenas fasciata monilis]
MQAYQSRFTLQVDNVGFEIRIHKDTDQELPQPVTAMPRSVPSRVPKPHICPASVCTSIALAEEIPEQASSAAQAAWGCTASPRATLPNVPLRVKANFTDPDVYRHDQGCKQKQMPVLSPLPHGQAWLPPSCTAPLPVTQRRRLRNNLSPTPTSGILRKKPSPLIC